MNDPVASSYQSEHVAPPARSNAHRALGRDWKLAYAFVVPLVLILVLLVAYPFVTGIMLSFQNKTIGGDARWVGTSNYQDLLFGEQYSSLFWNSVRVSALYTVVSVVLKLVLGMVMALMVNEQFRGRMLVRALLFLPWATPTIIVALTWRWIFDGSINGLFNLFRVDYLGATTLIQFLSDPDKALWAVIIAVTWQGTPFYTMMLLAGLQAIPAEQYEAAALDGAGPMQRFRDITLPGLVPAITITVLLSTIWTANSINFIYAMTRGGPANATMTFPMLAYEIGIAGARQLGMAAAVSVLFFPLFIVVIYFLTKRMLSTDSQN
ncbi:MAG TPA: sugar ABC transporter permease [Thermomicrobiales bacterium]|nr:sugar ABC transporter permease [Thermomicrobiales bacterium]